VIFTEEYYILFDIVILLLLAKILEELVARFRQPPILGDLLAGVILGPTVLGIIKVGDNVKSIAWVGIVALIFFAGLETEIKEFKRHSKTGLLVGLGGIITCFTLGLVYGLSLGYDLSSSLFLATMLTPTSVSVTVETLIQLKTLHTRVGQVIVSAAVADDIYALFLFTLTYTVVSRGYFSVSELAHVSLGLVILALISYLMFRYSNLIASLMSRLKTVESLFTFTFIMGLSVATLSSFFRLSPIVGAFLTGLALSSMPGSQTVKDRLSIIMAILTPLFFCYAGVLLNPWEVLPKINLSTTASLIMGILLLGILGKIVGCGLTAKLLNLTWTESLSVGIGMIPRAGVELVIAVTGLTLGVITQEVYFSILILIYVSSLITPSLLKLTMYLKRK